jgi:acyl carrier protein
VNDVTVSVKDFIMSQFLPGEDPEELTTTTPLVTSGLLDSLQRLDLVYFLEERYGIKLEAHEVDPSRMDTLDQITRLVETKMAAKN